MAKIICKKSIDHRHALWIAQALEDAGANVFSIIQDDAYINKQMNAKPSFWIWAKIEHNENYQAVEQAIDRIFEGKL